MRPSDPQFFISKLVEQSRKRNVRKIFPRACTFVCTVFDKFDNSIHIFSERITRLEHINSLREAAVDRLGASQDAHATGLFNSAVFLRWSRSDHDGHLRPGKRFGDFADFLEQVDRFVFPCSARFETFR